MNAVRFRTPDITGFAAVTNSLNRCKKPSFSRYSACTDGFRAATERRSS
jgi:hypothetical protein